MLSTFWFQLPTCTPTARERWGASESVVARSDTDLVEAVDSGERYQWMLADVGPAVGAPRRWGVAPKDAPLEETRRGELGDGGDAGGGADEARSSEEEEEGSSSDDDSLDNYTGGY